MKENIKLLAQRLWEKHSGKCVCGTIGALVAICILLFGFWNMLFIAALSGVGVFIGMNVDREGDTWQNIRDCIPKDIHRLR